MRAIWSAILLTVLFATLAFAQRGMHNYNPSTKTTAKGTVEQVKQVTGQHGWKGTHLTLKAESGTMDVHVGPSAYVSEQGFSFAAGDQIEVVGSKVSIAGKEVLIAREIKKDGKTLVLRDAQGIPKWSGARGRPQ